MARTLAALSAAVEDGTSTADAIRGVACDGEARGREVRHAAASNPRRRAVSSQDLLGRRVDGGTFNA